MWGPFLELRRVSAARVTSGLWQIPYASPRLNALELSVAYRIGDEANETASCENERESRIAARRTTPLNLHVLVQVARQLLRQRLRESVCVNSHDTDALARARAFPNERLERSLGPSLPICSRGPPQTKKLLPEPKTNKFSRGRRFFSPGFRSIHCSDVFFS